MRRRLAPKKSADPTLPHTSPVREGCWSAFRPTALPNKSLHFFGEVSRAEALGLNCEARPAAFAGRSELVLLWLGYRCCLYEKVSYPLRQTLRQPAVPSEGQEIRKLRVQLSSHRRVQRAGPVTRGVYQAQRAWTFPDRIAAGGLAGHIRQQPRPRVLFHIERPQYPAFSTASEFLTLGGKAYDEEIYKQSLRRRGLLLGKAQGQATGLQWKSVAGFQNFCGNNT
jgi:hypothetical protein